MSLQILFNISVVIFTVSYLVSLGLELKLQEAVGSLRSVRIIALVLFWGWVAGPALAWLLIRVMPLSDAHAAGLLLVSMAPTAPFYPMMVRRARGNPSAAAAFFLLTTLGTVLFLPLLAPLVITGLIVDAWSLAKPLLFMVLIPLLIGTAFQVYVPDIARTILPVVKKIGGIFLVITLVLTFGIYGDEMLSALGSFAPGAMTVFIIAITALSYIFSFGLDQPQRSSMSLAMCTRNIAAVFAGYFGITNPPPGLFVMIVLVVPIAAAVAFGAAYLFARQSPKYQE